jgi:hypothetical protein
VRPPAAAGQFYEADPARLRAQVEAHLAAAGDVAVAPRALVLPHAGHVYSGPIAATGWRCLARRRGALRRVVLLGPAHHVPLRGIAASGAHGFATPLGVVAVDRAAVAALVARMGVRVDDAPHAPEHSLEVHLPFLQVALGEGASIVPLLHGAVRDDVVADVLEEAVDGEETVLVVSSDLSHYLPAEEAERVDAATARAVEALEPRDVGPARACGGAAVRGLLVLARRRGWTARTLDLRHSGDTAGRREEVVGYGAFAFAA